MSDDDLRMGRMGRRERERGVDSIISNFMAAFNGNTITFAAEGASGRRERGRMGGEKRERNGG